MKLIKAIKNALLVGLVGASGIAFAVTPANTRITNTAQLNYTGLTNPILASVDITITLTPSAPSFSASLLPADQTTAEQQSANYLYTIVANANGSDLYNLSSNPFVVSNLNSNSTSAVFTQGVVPITSVTLGATAASAVASVGANTISVPSDGSANASVNNLTAGDTVVIGGIVYTILSVSDNGLTASITLTSNLTVAVAIGDLIAEQQTFTATIADVGVVTPSGSLATITMDIKATSAADPGQSITDQTVTTVVEVTFKKYVRNVTTASGSGGSVSINGSAFFPTSGAVTAKSGDTLEYALVVTAPATPLTGVALADTIPAFTSYVLASTTLNNAGVSDVLGACPLVAVGGMPVNSPLALPNVVAASQTATVTFQVTVD